MEEERNKRSVRKTKAGKVQMAAPNYLGTCLKVEQERKSRREKVHLGNPSISPQPPALGMPRGYDKPLLPCGHIIGAVTFCVLIAVLFASRYLKNCEEEPKANTIQPLEEGHCRAGRAPVPLPLPACLTEAKAQVWALAVACDALQECLGRGECDTVAVDAARANVTALLGTVELPQWRRRVTAHVAASLKKRQSRKRSRVGCMPRTNAHTDPPHACTLLLAVVGWELGMHV